jgi:hypothetical protein
MFLDALFFNFFGLGLPMRVMSAKYCVMIDVVSSVATAHC